MRTDAIEAVKRQGELEADRLETVAEAFAPEIVRPSLRTRTVRRTSPTSADRPVSVSSAPTSGVLAKTSAVLLVSAPVLDAPNVSGPRAMLAMERVFAYLQIETDITSIKLARERLEQNQALYEVRHQQQLKRIDEQIATMRSTENSKILSKIFNWITKLFSAPAAGALGYGAGLLAGELVGGVLSAAALYIPFIGPLLASLIQAATQILAPLAAIGMVVIDTMDVTGLEDVLKDLLTKLKQGQGMSRKEAKEAAEEILNGVKMADKLAATVVTIAVSIAITVMTAGAAAPATTALISETVAQTALTVVNALSGAVQGASAVISGVEAQKAAIARRAAEFAEANVKKSEADLREVQEFIAQTIDDINVLVDMLNKHYRNLQGIVKSHIQAMIRLAHGVGA